MKIGATLCEHGIATDQRCYQCFPLGHFYEISPGKFQEHPPKEPQPAPEQGMEEMADPFNQMTYEDRAQEIYPGISSMARNIFVYGARLGFRDGHAKGMERVSELEAQIARYKKNNNYKDGLIGEQTNRAEQAEESEARMRGLLAAAEKERDTLKAQLAEWKQKPEWWHERSDKVAAENASLRASLALARGALEKAHSYFSAINLPSHCVTLAQVGELREEARGSIRAALSQLPGVEKDAESSKPETEGEK